MAETTPPRSPEDIIWQGRPSHVINLKAYLVAVVVLLVGVGIGAAVLFTQWEGKWTTAALIAGIGLFISLLIASWEYLKTINEEYTLTSERLRYRRGIFAKHTDDLELYRVRDTHITEPLLHRVLGLGTIVLLTSDRSHPEFHMTAIAKPHEIRESIRRQVEHLREKKKVREVDFE